MNRQLSGRQQVYGSSEPRFDSEHEVFGSKQRSDARAQYRIGIVTNEFESPYYGRMLDSATRYLKTQGHSTIVQSNASTREGALDAWQSLMSCHCDGVILYADPLSENDLERLLRHYPHSVVMNRRVEHFLNRSIYLDNRQGGALAASHLLEHGHRKLAMVTGPRDFFEVSDRCDGFANETFALSHNAKVCIEIEGDFTAESGALAMSQIVGREEPVTAVFFHNDEMAMGAIYWCRHHGVRVPQDISIIGFDDSSICQHATPQLSTIAQPLEKIGAAAATCLIKLLEQSDEGHALQTDQRFSPRLASRSSVAQIGNDQENKISQVAPLRSREKSCIYWAAKGKTSWETSQILDLSESTIVFHLRNASKKLNTVNRTHTVAEALRQGIISI